MIFFATFMIMSFGISTYVRNMAWRTELSILEDAVQKAPNAARPLSNLSRVYYMKIGRPDISLKMLTKALTLKKNNTYQESMVLSGIGNIYYANGYDKKAIRYYRKAHKKYPGNLTNRYKLAIASATIGNYKESKKHVNKVIQKVPDNETAALNLKGLVLAKEKKFNQAFKAFKKCLGKSKNDKNALLNIGALYYFSGDYRRAETFFEIAHVHHRNELFALLWLIEVNLKTNDRQDTHKYLEKLFLMVSVKEILSLPKLLSDKNVFDKGIMKPYPSDMLIKEIAGKLKINTK
ncbi:MAG: tetratricopeptide repeat protein [Deltaproteobacteria bacterium]|nr:tetratricopeptide repeat protein [Deltaproteobacteria bacterium]